MRAAAPQPDDPFHGIVLGALVGGLVWAAAVGALTYVLLQLF